MAPATTSREVIPIPSELDVRSMVDAIPAVLCYFDADLVCRFANCYLETWYRMSPVDMVGRSLAEIIGREDFVARTIHLDRVRRGEPSAFVTRVPIRGGGWRDADVRYVPRMTPDGPDGFYILTFDVANLHQRFHSVFDANATGFWELDLRPMMSLLGEFGVVDVTSLAERLSDTPDLVRRSLDKTPVVQVNAKAAEMFGITPDEARTQPFGRWCCEASLPAFTQNLEAFLSNRYSFECETVMVATGGRCLNVFLTCAFAKNATDETTVIVGVTDIGDRIAKERELARTQADLAHAARVATLGELTASIAHEVNQPLAAVTTNGNAALRWINRPEPNLEEARRAIERMVAEGTRAAEIIARTRDLARNSVPRQTPIDVNPMVGETVTLVGRQIDALGAELCLELAPDLPVISGDRIQLQQVLINLVINAAQAMTDQEPPRRAIIRTSKDGDMVMVEVLDTGPGLPEGGERLFEAFYTTKEAGMGMGLSISRTIVAAHGGTLVASNRADGGARFAFMLPAATT